MSEDSTKNNNKYFCNRCKDRNWLIECGCGVCGEILSRTDNKYRIRNHIYGHYQKQRIGELNPTWKGYRRKIGNYWHLFIPDYFSSDKQGYIDEHVYNYQEYYKCCLLPWTVVHHIDPVTKDYCNNMPWNLTTMMRGEHVSYHNKTTRVYIRKDWTGTVCSQCGSDKTYIPKNGNPHWLNDKKGGWWCLSCYGMNYRKGLI